MESASFCKKCGGYLKPDEGSVRLDDSGTPIVLCENCATMQNTRELSLGAGKGG